MEQIIYARIEYPTQESSDQIWETLKHLQPVYNNHVQIGGISVAIRVATDRAVILLAYDEESASYLKLGFGSIPGAKYTNLRKSNV